MSTSTSNPSDNSNPVDDDVKFVDLPQGKIGYVEFGKKTDPLVLFCHGFPDSLRTWNFVAPKVADAGFYCVCIGLPGYLPSDIPDRSKMSTTQVTIDQTNPKNKYAAANTSADVIEFVKKLGAKSCVLVGHDWGAFTVYATTGRDHIDNENIIKRVVGVGIPPSRALSGGVSTLYKARHFVYYNSFLNYVGGTKANNFKYLDELYKRWSPTWNVPSNELDQIKKDFSQPLRTEAAIEWYWSIRGSGDQNKQISGQRFKIPLLVFGGLDDGALTADVFKASTKQMHRENDKQAPCQIALVPGAGHWPHREKPKTFVKKLIKFLKTDEKDLQSGEEILKLIEDDSK